MFSSDKNIERIADFVEEVKRWIIIKKEYTKLDIIDKVVQVCTALILLIVFLLLVIMVLVFLSFAGAYFLSQLTGSLGLAFLAISVFYAILIAIVYTNRKTYIEKPLVQFLVNILLDEEEKENNNNSSINTNAQASNNEYAE